MKEMKTTEAVGQVLCHDITRIVRGESKGPAFLKGHVITEEDIPVLLSLGKDHIFIWEKDETKYHENEAAEILYQLCATNAMQPTPVKEGKIEVIAKTDGLLKVDSAALLAVNSLGEMMIATRHGNTVVKAGDKLAGTRIIPLVIEKEKMHQARELVKQPILKLLPFVRKKAAVLTTGNEIFHGRIQDTFTPVLKEKLAEFGCDIVFHEIYDDDPKKVEDGIHRAVAAGAELVLCTGGMSVDPDDKTPLAIKNSGARIVSYGAPVLPGAMFLLAYLGENEIPVLGLPGCVMYARRTIFDLVLPRILANDPVTQRELAAFGEGGLCLSCENCTYPNCGFGKGSLYEG